MPSNFPPVQPKPKLEVREVLPNQIYTVDDFFSPSELRAVLAWAQSLELEGPKKPGKGEAERTGRRASLHSSEIASSLLRLISPFLPSLSPPYTSQPGLSPNIRVYHYPPHTFFGQHYDMPQLDHASRRLSCWTVLVYLSDGVTGGGTTFYPHEETGKKGKKGSKTGFKYGQKGKVTVEPKAGRMLLHWHGVSGGGCMKHEGDEVLSGDKWVLRTDVLA
ncbi:hypothetical protein J008_03993 [Cryptococcus neoformans]|nr:hypothetical protein C362_03641 [Cryptococcus neoformans var. grubii Bt1]OXH30162.1 hypothetical protein J008_03993 [Cryptococcus neoformans var. grubii]